MQWFQLKYSIISRRIIPNSKLFRLSSIFYSDSAPRNTRRSQNHVLPLDINNGSISSRNCARRSGGFSSSEFDSSKVGKRAVISTITLLEIFYNPFGIDSLTQLRGGGDSLGYRCALAVVDNLQSTRSSAGNGGGECDRVSGVDSEIKVVRVGSESLEWVNVKKISERGNLRELVPGWKIGRSLA